MVNSVVYGSFVKLAINDFLVFFLKKKPDFKKAHFAYENTLDFKRMK